jgi:hypothetical protein
MIGHLPNPGRIAGQFIVTAKWNRVNNFTLSATGIDAVAHKFAVLKRERFT